MRKNVSFIQLQASVQFQTYFRAGDASTVPLVLKMTMDGDDHFTLDEVICRSPWSQTIEENLF